MNNSLFCSFNIGELNSPIGFFNRLRTIWRLSDEHCLPAIVKEYNRNTHIAKVIPLVKKVFDSDSGKVLKDRAIVEVPVLNFNHGKIEIDVPLKEGDTGYIISCDRRCDNAIAQNKFNPDENKGPQAPDDYSIGQFSAGFFIPCSWKDSNYSNDDSIIIKVDKITVTITHDDIKIDCKEATTCELVSDIRYDIVSHQLQKKVRTCKMYGDFIFDISEEGAWKIIEGGQAELLEIE